MNKKLKILITFIALILLILTYIYINKKVNSSGTITIEIVYEDKIDSKDYEINKMSLVEILESNYDIIIYNGMIIKIANLEPKKDEFIKILINDQFSTSGIKSIELKDKDKISFVIDRINDYE